jgi:type VI secretion system secreted protein Hcp
VASVFLHLDGIDGESSDAHHRGEIELTSWAFGVANSGTTHMGGGGAGTGRASVTDLSVRKRVDIATPALLQAATTGKRLSAATVTVRRAGAAPFDYLRVALTDVMVTGCSLAGEGDEPSAEEVTLSFGKVQVTYTPQAADGSPGPAHSFGWDVARNGSL